MIQFPITEEPDAYNENPILFWNWVGLEMNRLTHSIGGPQGGPVLSASALGMLHLAIHDAYFAIVPPLVPPPSGRATYLDPNSANVAIKLPSLHAGSDPLQAVAGAAIAVLSTLYLTPSTQIAASVTTALTNLLNEWKAKYPMLAPGSEGFKFGDDVGHVIVKLLAVGPTDPGVGSFNPITGKTYKIERTRFKFQDDPGHSVRVALVDPFNPGAGTTIKPATAYGPFYGDTAVRFAVQKGDAVRALDMDHKIDLPPGDTTPKPDDRWVNDAQEYHHAFKQVKMVGGAPNANETDRKPDETVAALFWAYDGANLIGTPPRLYNQILRKLAWDKKTPGAAPNDPAVTAEFARLFALANAAMADAGIFAWREKYYYGFWRPLSGIRQHDLETGPKESTMATGHEHLDHLADPFWQAYGAPDTNTNNISFKPNFPAYPSGHATFGAACFQIARLFYKQRDGLTFANDEADELPMSFVSDELNGINRDLYQPYNLAQPITDQPGLIRTRIVRRFESLWSMIYENAISRIYLGVHWRFDAFAAQDGIDNLHKNNETFKAPMNVKDVKYQTTGAGGLQIGGVPLGLGIANDIFSTGLIPTPVGQQPRPPVPAPTPSILVNGRLRPDVKVEKAPLR